MADEVPAGESQPNPTPTPPAILPQGNNADVVKQLTTVTEQLTQAKAQLETLAKERDSFKTGLDQTTAKLTDLEKQFSETSTLLKTRDGEFATLQTQLQQTLGQVGELTTARDGLTKQVDLFNLIADTPDFHPMVASFKNLSKIIKPDAPVDDVKALLGAMAADNKQQVQGALEIFRAGGSLSTSPVQQTPGGPKNMEEAWQTWQNAYRTGDKEAMRQAMQLVNQFSQAGDNQPA